jgi:predicted nucleic acid-binding protein
MAQLLVLDAGAAVTLTVNFKGKGATVANVVRGNSLIVPDLFFVEVSNVLRKLALSKADAFSWADAHDAIAQIDSLKLKVVSARQLLASLWDNNTVKRIDSYDGCYAALARNLSAPLVTTDQKASFEEAGVHNVIRI